MINNGTNITWNNTNSEEPIEYNWPALLLFIIICMAIWGNVMVCLAVKFEVKLRNRFNFFLVSLAMSDMMSAILVMPLSVIKVFIGHLPVTRIICLAWFSLDVLFTSSTIIHLCIISIDRYFALKDPIKYRHSKTKFYVALKICIVWVLALCIAGPLFISTVIFEKPNESYKGCGPTNATFIVSATVISFYVPLVIMLITYILTVHTLKKQTNLAFISPSKQMRELSDTSENELSMASAGNSPCLDRDRPSFKLKASPRKETLVVHMHNGRTSSFKETNPLLAGQPARNSVATATIYDLRQSNFHRDHHSRSKSLGSKESSKRKNRRSIPDANENIEGESSLTRSRARLLVKHTASDASSDCGNNSNANRSSVRRTTVESVHKGRKAVRILGILFAVFVMCYLPFFATYIISGLCQTCQQYVSPQMVTAFEWLGYSGAFINPIIYRVFNPDFRRAFEKLMRCQYRNWERRGTCTQL